MKSGKAIQDRIKALLARREAHDASESKRQSAPLTESVDWSNSRKDRAALLADELAIRKDYAGWLEGDAKDRRDYAIAQEALWQQQKVEVTKTLLAAGWTTGTLVGSDIVARHPSVRALFGSFQGCYGATAADNAADNQAAVAGILPNCNGCEPLVKSNFLVMG